MIEDKLFLITCKYNNKAKQVTDSFGVEEGQVNAFINQVLTTATKGNGQIPSALMKVLSEGKDSGGILLALACMQIADIVIKAKGNNGEEQNRSSQANRRI